MEFKRILSLLFASVLAFALTASAGAQDNPSQQQQPETSAPQQGPQQSPQKMGKSKTYTGEVMDSACAKVGSHDVMMKQEGAKDAKECTDKCVQAGSTYVLYNSTKKRAYQLDDQDKAKEFSGQKVTVTGHFDRATKTLHVENIEGAS